MHSVYGFRKQVDIAFISLCDEKGYSPYLFQRFPLPDVKCIYIGDDDRDEEAFPAMHEHDGIAIKVVQPSQLSKPTGADFIFDSPQSTIHWLEGLVR